MVQRYVYMERDICYEIYVKYPMKFKDLQPTNQHPKCGYVADKIIFD